MDRLEKSIATSGQADVKGTDLTNTTLPYSRTVHNMESAQYTLHAEALPRNRRRAWHRDLHHVAHRGNDRLTEDTVVDINLVERVILVLYVLLHNNSEIDST
jgi:hypothetical protein